MFIQIGNKGIHVRNIKDILFMDNEVRIWMVSDDFPTVLKDEEKEIFLRWWQTKAEVWKG